LHITIIYNSKYFVKQLQIHDYNSFHHNMILQKVHTKDEHKIHYRNMCFSILLKT
jgi:hypothetical protein